MGKTQKPLLAIDTSGAMSTAVVFADGGAVERNLLEFRLHAELLNVLVSETLTEAGITAKDLAGVAVGIGPGPFTGLRIGIAAARALAFALDIPLYGVGSLDALALQALEQLKLELPPAAEIVVVTDARRREVYWAVYRMSNTNEADTNALQLPTQITGPYVSKASEIATSISNIEADRQGRYVVGYGAELYPDSLHLTPRAPKYPSAAAIGRIARFRAISNQAQPTDPLYLRRPDIHSNNAPA